MSYLNKARAHLHQPAYRLPSDFAKLSPPRQAFVLTNLDRLQYGLTAIPGLTRSLNADARHGVRADGDPRPSDPKFRYYTANWGGGLPNILFVYGAWMYDDGPGGGNLDCTRAHPSGCWSHRKSVLHAFGHHGPAAMGAAAGKDRHGRVGYAMLLGQGTGGYRPSYIYTWKQAKAEGAG